MKLSSSKSFRYLALTTAMLLGSAAGTVFASDQNITLSFATIGTENGFPSDLPSDVCALPDLVLEDFEKSEIREMLNVPTLDFGEHDPLINRPIPSCGYPTRG